MREIGGKTARFGLTSPSSAFFLGIFRSMREMLSASRLEDRPVSEAGFESGGVGFTAGATSSFSFCFGSFVLAAAVAGLRAAGAPRAAAGLRVAVLLLVFVAIVVRLQFCSWPVLP